MLRALGWLPQRLADVPGLVVARTIAMLVNEASDAVEQGVCDAAGADAAMTLGVNYPAGPFAWLALWGADATVRPARRARRVLPRRALPRQPATAPGDVRASAASPESPAAR